MTEKRFTLGKDYDCDGNWEYCYDDNVTGKRYNFADENCEYDFLRDVNTAYEEIQDENEQLKSKLLKLEEDRDYYKTKASSLEEGYLQLQDREIRLKKENEKLQQELFESEEECLMIDYNDNPVRRDVKIELLKEHFKERFGRDFE